MNLLRTASPHLGRWLVWIAAMAALCLSANLCFAQARATIFGTVTDPSGAVLVGVQVTAVNVATQQARTTTTTTDGKFLFADLIPADYKVTIEAPGFKQYIQQDLHLQVDENRQLSVILNPGAVSQQVTVMAEAAQVDTRTPIVQEVVDAARVKDLPLNGRNPLQLQYLVAGAGQVSQLGGGQAQNEVVAFNGARQNANNYTLDGADNEDPFFDSPSVYPNPDALQEFSLQTSNYGAQEGRSAGAQMNALTRSGTNEFHGVLFEYLRNQMFDSAGYFANSVAPFHRNQFGGTVGGPILRNRTFFFFSYQGTREASVPNAETLTVPSNTERSGNFSDVSKQLKDPCTGKNATGNNLSDCLNPASAAFIKTFVPEANLPGNLYTYSADSKSNDDQYIGKIDTNLNQHDILSGRILYDSSFQNQIPSTNDLPGFTTAIDYKDWNVAINEVHTFSPHLLNQFVFGYNNIARLQAPSAPVQKTWGDFGAGIARAATGTVGYDTEVQSYFTAETRWLLNQYRHGSQFSDHLSWLLGAHSLSLGGDVRQSFTNEFQNFQTDSQLIFAATYTGNQLADFMTGHPNSMKQGSPNGGKPTNLSPDLFAEDDWTVTSRLTLNLGIRWDPFIPYTDQLQRLAQFRPGVQSTQFPAAPVGYVFPGDPGVPHNTVVPIYLSFAPRVGFACNLFGNGRTSLRGGYGVYYGNIREQALNNISSDQPYALALTIAQPAGGVNNPYSSIGGNPFPFSPPTTSAARAAYVFTNPLSTLTEFDPDFRNSRIEQWNLNIQQQISDWILTIAYVGSEGAHQFLTIEKDPAVYGKTGTTQARRFYAPLYASIPDMMSEGHSSYNSLQLSASKRFTKGLTVLANYTWAKSLDNGSSDTNTVTDPFNLAMNRGLSDFDIPQSFVGSFIWQIPGGAHLPTLAKIFVGGWEVNGITTLQTGSPFSVLSGVDNSQSGVNADWADRSGNPRLSGGRSHAAQIAEYFNTKAYQLNAVGTFGNSGRNSLIGPGTENIDLGASKYFPSFERTRLQFRAESFNLFNHTDLMAPAANFSATTFGKISGQSNDPRVLQFALRLEF